MAYNNGDRAILRVATIHELCSSDDDAFLVDLLTDLMHVADRCEGQFGTFRAALATAKRHYAVERMEDGVR